MKKDIILHSPLSRRRVIWGLTAFAGQNFFSGCGGGHPTPGSPQPNSPFVLQPTPTGPLTTATVSISASSGNSVGAGFIGLSYEKSILSAEPLLVGQNGNLAGLLNRLGKSILRIGGNTVDQIVWNPSGAGQTSGQVGPPDVDALAAFLQMTGWQCLYGINLAGAASGATTPALAAAEVAYVAKTLGSSLYGIEIGNEPDLYSDTYFPNGWDLKSFETLWEEFRTAILAAVPHVTITGPASAGNTDSWTVPFGEYATSQKISLLTQHYFRGNGLDSSSTAAELLSADAQLTSECQALLSAANQIGIPWRMTATNSFYNGGVEGVSDTFASSLWVIDHLATIALNGGSGANMHCGMNNPSYTPIADTDGTVTAVRPEFYGLLMFNMLGQGNLLKTSVSAGTLNMTAYCVQPSSGGLNLVLVNKDSTQNVKATVNCGRNVGQTSLLQMTAPNLSATTGVAIQGATVDLDGTFAPNAPYGVLQSDGETLICYVPALSAVILQIS